MLYLRKMTSSRGNFYDEEIDDDEFLRHPKSGTAGTVGTVGYFERFLENPRHPPHQFCTWILYLRHGYN